MAALASIQGRQLVLRSEGKHRLLRRVAQAGGLPFGENAPGAGDPVISRFVAPPSVVCLGVSASFATPKLVRPGKCYSALLRAKIFAPRKGFLTGVFVPQTRNILLFPMILPPSRLVRRGKPPAEPSALDKRFLHLRLLFVVSFFFLCDLCGLRALGDCVAGVARSGLSFFFLGGLCGLRGLGDTQSFDSGRRLTNWFREFID